MPSMKDSHRLFLQSFLSRSILPPRDVRKLHKMACTRFEEDYSEDGLVEFVNTINTNIKSVYLEIRKAINEDTGTHCYGLVNTRESDITKLASDYTVTELEYFKKLVECIVESSEGKLPKTEALSLAEKLPEKKMTKKEAEELLLKLSKEHWVSCDTEGWYSMSARAVLELEQYLLEQYPDSTVKCNMCKRICLQGQSCDSCEVKLHFHCASRYFDKMSKTCPGASCGAPWPHQVPLPTRTSNRDPSDSQGSGDVSMVSGDAKNLSGRKRRATHAT